MRMTVTRKGSVKRFILPLQSPEAQIFSRRFNLSCPTSVREVHSVRFRAHPLTSDHDAMCFVPFHIFVGVQRYCQVPMPAYYNACASFTDVPLTSSPSTFRCCLRLRNPHLPRRFRRRYPRSPRPQGFHHRCSHHRSPLHPNS